MLLHLADVDHKGISSQPLEVQKVGAGEMAQCEECMLCVQRTLFSSQHAQLVAYNYL